MTTETYSRAHTGLAEIPKSWDKAYSSRKRRTWIARLAVWGVIAGFAVALLMTAGRIFG